GTRQDSSPPTLFKNTESFPRILHLRGLRQLPRLVISFAVTPEHQAYATKPGEYLANLLNRNAEGSLGAELKKTGWIHDLTAGTRLSTRHYQTFDVQFELSAAGQERWDRVVAWLFGYLSQIRHDGVQQEIYSRQSRKARAGFEFNPQQP